MTPRPLRYLVVLVLGGATVTLRANPAAGYASVGEALGAMSRVGRPPVGWLDVRSF